MARSKSHQREADAPSGTNSPEAAAGLPEPEPTSEDELPAAPTDDVEEGSAAEAEGLAQVAPGEEGVGERPITAGIGALEAENAGPGAAAFFDVDNTIMRGSSLAALAKGMADRDYFTASEILDFTWRQLKFVLSGREDMDDITAATENGLLFVKGREPIEIETLADEVYDEKMIQRLWAGTIALTNAHLAAGHEVWLVSATPVEVAEVIAERLGLTGGLGTVAEVVEGRYTGKLSGVPLHGPAKAAAVQRIAQERGLDLSRCAAYSDSANDIPMLSLVGYPVAINPDGKLRTHAREHGWPIRDYRIRAKPAVRKGVPAAAAAGIIAGTAVGVAKAIAVIRQPGRD
ncbi:MAG: HAD-IB family hydrolase [Candidatus Nanopelagicales bacterium]